MLIVIFLLFASTVLMVGYAAVSSARASKDPDAPSMGAQLVRLLLLLLLCSLLTGTGWWMSTEGVGLSQDFSVEVGLEPSGQGVRGTSVRHGSRRGRSHLGRGLHGGK